MKDDPFAVLLQQFFADYLQLQRGLSPHTIAAYRDAFRLLLGFLSTYYRRKIDQLTLDSLRPEAILAFLEHLERARGNTPRSRNVRLAAIRTFVRFAIGKVSPDTFLVHAQRILAIPLKKSPRRQLAFLTRTEIEAVLNAADESTWSGQRDRLLFLLLYNTGARVSEALHLQGKDRQDRAVLLHGKGRKERLVPLWPKTDRLFCRWCRQNHVGAESPVFTNRAGGPLSRDGVAHRLSWAVHRAIPRCPSLSKRTITPHTLRHTCAMHLMHSGVALEVIALWLGHERPATTHLYIEADIGMKRHCLDRLSQPRSRRANKHDEPHSHLLDFLEAL